MKKTWQFATLAAAACLGLSACGGGTAGTGASSQVGAESGPQDVTAPIVKAVTKDDKLAGQVADLQGKPIVVGANLQTPPNGFLAADARTPIGFEIDLITAINKKLGLETQIQNMPFDTLITSLQSKRVSMTISSMNDNATRQEKIDFVDYFNSGITLMVKKGNPSGIKSPEDLCGKKASTAPGSSQEEWMEKVGPSMCQAKGKPPIQIVTSNLDQQRLNDLKSGRNDTEVNDLPYVSYATTNAGKGQDFEAVPGKPILATPYGIGFHKDTPELRDAVRGALQELIDDGTYGKILKAWNVSNGAIVKTVVNGGK
ncbi:ABC transporter substrate-binding protein [Nonomuraea sp. NPDC050153]|uniref:ABC transporter substrate-binding protein n=1 Tax=Nonomuraea sp. NPDC050153 TaxID=3364359 RepID=UPI0037924B68